MSSQSDNDLPSKGEKLYILTNQKAAKYFPTYKEMETFLESSLETQFRILKK